MKLLEKNHQTFIYYRAFVLYLPEMQLNLVHMFYCDTKKHYPEK